MCRITRMKKSRRAVAAYISWVLLLGFAIAISVFMYSWINSQVDKTTVSIEQRSDTALCDDVLLAVKNSCQNTQTLNMNISNIKLLGISGLKFRFYDLYDNQDSREISISLRPGDTEDVEIIKQGTLKQAEIIPITSQDNKVVTCTESTVTLQDIKFC